MPTQSSKDANAPDQKTAVSVKEIAVHCNSYKGSDAKRSIFQLVSTLILFVVNCALMIYSLNVSFWLTLLLLIPASGFLVRIFVFQHDCGHGSFFNSKTANDWTGRFLGLLTMTPYDSWRRAHNKHHATSGGLDRRGIGAIDTITVREYEAMSKRMRFFYRLYRHPITLVFGAPLYVIVAQRLPFKQETAFHEGYKSLPVRSIWKSIMLTNLCLVLFFGALAMMIGWGTLLAVYLPIVVAASWTGSWLFYVQHQFEETYWEHDENWSIQEAALLGSSYYEMPKILQWFTANIGLHHIHHLCSKIPNYKLQDCMDARPELAGINRLTLRESLGCVQLKLWDEKTSQMVGLSAISG